MLWNNASVYMLVEFRLQYADKNCNELIMDVEFETQITAL